jgi:hypothetical protein
VIRSTAPARGQNGTRRVVLAEPVGAVDGEQLREPRAGTIDPALDRPYRALADRSRLFVGEAGEAISGYRRSCRRRLRLRGALAVFRAEQVAEDGDYGR